MAHPSRIIGCGPCHVGKSFLFLNLMMRADPVFDRIVIYHNDPESEEYSAVNAEYVSEVPTIDFFDKNEKNLLVFEGINLKDMKRDQIALIDRYMDVGVPIIILVFGLLSRIPSVVPQGFDGLRILLSYGIMEMLIQWRSYQEK